MGKILITGTGRAGTTLLMQLLTQMGYDTGMKSVDYDFRSEIRAGQEIPMPYSFLEDKEYEYRMETPIEEAKNKIEQLPRIIKVPSMSMVLKYLLANKVIEVDHAIIPFRDLVLAARSRIKVGLDWKVAGGWWGATDDDREMKQRMVLYSAVGRMMEALFLYDVKYTVIKFPMLVYEPGYLYQKLLEAFPDMDEKKFMEAHAMIVKKEMVTEV